MKKKVIIALLVLVILAVSSVLIWTLVSCIKGIVDVKNEMDKEAIENKNTIKVDEDSSIKIVEKFDESMFKGKKSLVFFWASWCPHCQGEYDVVKKVVSEYQNRGFNIYVISHDYETSDLAEFMKENDFNYEVYFDEQRVIRYNFDPEASSVPLTYVIDENANLIHSHNGTVTLEEVDNIIKEYINK